RARRALAGQRSGAQPRGRPARQPRLDQRRRDREPSQVARDALRQDGRDGQPRSEDRGRISDCARDARRTLRQRGGSGVSVSVEVPARPAAAVSAVAPSEFRPICLAAALAPASAAFWFIPLGIAPEAHKALAIGLFMIAMWMTQVLDHGIAGILGCFLFWMLGVVRFDVAFSGFADTSAWFLFGAVCFGLMAGESGLARRLAFAVMRAVGHSYSRLLLGLIISNFLLTIVVPSGIARVVIMAAIAMWLGEAVRVGKGSTN